MRSRTFTIGSFLAAFVSACIGTTGDQIVTFHADAAGPSYANGGTLDITTDLGWHVVLTKATLHVGALYLDQSTVVSGAQVTQCILPGTYVGQVTSAVDVDLLTHAAVAFPTQGEGTTLPAESAQVWLTHGDVNQVADTTPVLVLEGTADKNGDVRPFVANITIGGERVSGSDNAGADAICRQRIVSPSANVVLANGGTLHLVIDPRFLLSGVQFGELSLGDDGKTYAFKNDSSDQPSRSLYSALHSTGGLFSLGWSP